MCLVSGDSIKCNVSIGGRIWNERVKISMYFERYGTKRARPGKRCQDIATLPNHIGTGACNYGRIWWSANKTGKGCDEGSVWG